MCMYVLAQKCIANVGVTYLITVLKHSLFYDQKKISFKKTKFIFPF